MKKRTVRSLTAKGYSQYKIAKILKIRKSKVVAAQHRLKIGVRASKKGAVKFWKHVKALKEIEGLTRKEAIEHVKYGKYWFERRQKRLTGLAKAKDKMFFTWNEIKRGKIDKKVFESEEMEEVMEGLQYD